MDISKALQIVLELASQNIIDEIDEPEQAAEQQKAIDMVAAAYLPGFIP